MSASFYNPYESNTTEGYGEIVKERLKNTFSISNAAWFFVANPNNFNISKGLRVPLSGLFRKGLWTGIGEDIKNRKSGAFIGRTVSGLMNPLYFGGNLANAKRGEAALYSTMSYRASQHLKRRITGTSANLSDKMIPLLTGGKNLNAGKLKVGSGTLRDKLRRELSSGGLTTSESAEKFIGNLYGDPTGEIVKKLNSKVRVGLVGELTTAGQKSSEDMGRIAKYLATAKKANLGRYAIRGGLIGGKLTAFGIIGALVFSTAMSLGEPIGKAMISSVDKGLGFYNNRFMVETGGGLARGYLSQGAATERQRAVQAISKAYINGRSAIGQEAFFLHS